MRRKLFISISLVLIISSLFAQENRTQKARLEKHVYYFAADSLNGRRTGSSDNKKVAAYIKNQFEQIGLSTYYQYIDKKQTQQNVIAVLEGNDPVLKNEVIIIGAHYDHLGIKNNKVYNGADDNASGSATIIEMARQLEPQKALLKRTIIFIAFDAEEVGLVGSGYYIKDFIENNKTQNIVLMMSLDMVGYLKQSNKLRISGVKTIKDYDQYFKQIQFDENFHLVLKDFDNSIFTGSDHGPFLNKKIPAFHVTTGLKSPYHKPEDDADLIDYDGLSIIVDYFAQLNYVFATAEKLESSENFGKSAMDEKNSYFGIIASIGSHRNSYTHGNMTGKKGLGVSAGLYGKVRLAEHFSLKGEIDYEYKVGKRREGELFTHSITTPITLFTKVTVQNVMELSAGIGGYYTYSFAGGINNLPNVFSLYSPHEYGLQAELEMRTGVILFGLQWKFAINNVMKNAAFNDLSRNRGVIFKIGYIF